MCSSSSSTMPSKMFAVVGLAAVVSPTVNEVPADFPETVLWRFQLASLGTQLMVWATLGLGFGALTARRQRRSAGVASSTVIG